MSSELENALLPFLKPLLEYTPEMGHVFFGLLLSPKHKELREISSLWACVHDQMPEDVRRQSIIEMLEKYENDLIKLMAASHEFARVEMSDAVQSSQPQVPSLASGGAPIRRAGARKTGPEEALDYARAEYDRWVHHPLSEVCV